MEMSPFPCDRSKVLVVDDEQVIRKLFEMVLSWELPDTRIEVASNGQEALQAFQCGHHAVLLMDLHMPVMDGQHAFHEIEKSCQDQNWEMPHVVFCTGFAPPASLRRIVAPGSIHKLLCKPVSNECLVETVRGSLDRTAPPAEG